MDILRAKQHGRPFVRPVPLSAVEVVGLTMLALLPGAIHICLRYRLGPYRCDGRKWNYDLRDISDCWDHMRLSFYVDEGHPLLMLLWLNTGLSIPWLMLIISVVRHRPVV